MMRPCQHWSRKGQDMTLPQMRKIAIPVFSIISIILAWFFYQSGQVLLTMGFVGVPINYLLHWILPTNQENLENRLKETEKDRQNGDHAIARFAIFSYLIDTGKFKSRWISFLVWLLASSVAIYFIITTFGVEEWWYEKKIKLITTAVFAGVILVLFVLLAKEQGWGPFKRRPR